MSHKMFSNSEESCDGCLIHVILYWCSTRNEKIIFRDVRFHNNNPCNMSLSFCRSQNYYANKLTSIQPWKLKRDYMCFSWMIIHLRTVNLRYITWITYLMTKPKILRRKARRRLLTKKPKIIPVFGTQYASVISSRSIQNMTSIDDFAGLGPNHFNILRDSVGFLFSKQLGVPLNMLGIWSSWRWYLQNDLRWFSRAYVTDAIVWSRFSIRWFLGETRENSHVSHGNNKRRETFHRHFLEQNKIINSIHIQRARAFQPQVFFRWCDI